MTSHAAEVGTPRCSALVSTGGRGSRSCRLYARVGDRCRAHSRVDSAELVCAVCERGFVRAAGARKGRGGVVVCSRECRAELLASRGAGRYRSVTTGGAQSREHRIVAARALGRPLPRRVPVHHHDGDGRNNRGCNLVICQDQAYHMLLERRTRIVRAGGDPDTEAVCFRCKRPRPLGSFLRRKSGPCIGRHHGACDECRR